MTTLLKTRYRLGEILIEERLISQDQLTQALDIQRREGGPLGAILMPALHITPAQFGLVVSAYAFSAGISGILAAGFADRFDRKTLLLFFYVGFIFGTLLCGLAPSYGFLLAARTITGLFGGVMGSIVFSITTDLFPFEVRGRVMGVVQTAFAGSQILGIPVGLLVSNQWNWHAAFFMIVGFGSAVAVLIWHFLRPVNAHLQLHTGGHPLRHLLQTVKTPLYLQAFATTALLSTGGFMLMPFASDFSVHNLGVSLEVLPIVYFVTGISAVLSGPLIGIACDHFGKFRVFLTGSALALVMISIYTHLGQSPLSTVILVNVLLYTGVSSRMIASQALMTAVPNSKSRGAFMAVSSAIQYLSGGVASAVAGLIVAKGAGGHVEHFDTLGTVVIGALIVTAILMYRIQKILAQNWATSPAVIRVAS